MRAPISVIVPTLQAQAGLPACLASLGEGLSEGLIRELVISDGGSTDDTLRIAEAAGAEVVTGPPSRGGQLRRGVARAQGAWLLVLHADTRLQPGWSAQASRALAQPGAYFCDLAFDASGLVPRTVAGWANLRARRLGLPYGDQGLLVDRDSYDASGGYPDIPLMEDVVIADRLRDVLHPLGAVALTSADKYRRQGWVRRGAGNLMTLARFRLGADPIALARRYDA